MDAEQRADWLLAELACAPDNEQGENFILFRLESWFPALQGFGPLPGGPDLNAMKAQRRETDEAMRDAYQALMTRGQIAPDRRSGNTFCRVTKAGHDHLAALSAPEQDRISFARRALTVELHPALQRRHVDTHFRQGKFETALRDGATFLEDAIRTLSGLPATTLGVNLASQAFAKAGPLTDPQQHLGEQTGAKHLFEGFFGAVRNVVAHKEFRYSEPREALQLLMLLDLLTVKLEDAARRTDQQLT
jgi:uncharacterized protein (TIGR02391 family)